MFCSVVVMVFSHRQILINEINQSGCFNDLSKMTLYTEQNRSVIPRMNSFAVCIGLKS